MTARRLPLFVLALALLVSPAAAQFTTVTGTVTDPDGLPYAYGTLTPVLIFSGGTPTLPNGSPYSPPSQATGLDVNGKFIVTLADTTLLTPSGSKWNFIVCSGVGTVQPAFGKGPVCFSLAAPITISGASQSITTQLTAAAVALTFPFSTGGSAPAAPVGSVQYNNAGVLGSITSVAAGSEYVSNGTLVPPITRLKLYIDPRDSGVDCSGTLDSAAAMASAITATISSGKTAGKLNLPNPCTIKLASQLAYTKLYGFHLDGGASQGQAPLNTGFVWAGAANGVPVLINQVRDAVFENFYVYCPNGCNTGILIDETGSVTDIVSNDILHNIAIFNNIQNANFKGISLCPTAPGNCEKMVFDDINVVCPGGSATANNNGSAIVFESGTAQPFGSAIMNPEIAGCSRGIDIENANVLNITGGLFESDYTDLYAGAGRGIFWGFTRSEQSQNQVMIASSVFDLATDHISFAGLTPGTTTYTFLSSTQGTSLRVYHNDWDNIAVTPIAGPTSGNSATLDSQDNNYPNNTTCPNFTQFGHGGMSRGDNCLDPYNFYTEHLNNRSLYIQAMPAGTANFSSPSQSVILEGSNFSGVGNADAAHIRQIPFGSAATSAYLAVSHPFAITTEGMSPPPFFGGISTSVLATPSITTIVNLGTPGGTSYSYKIAAFDGNGAHTPVSAAITTATGNATLSGGNCNQIKWAENSGAYYYTVYRTASGGTPSTTGVIGTIVWPSQLTNTGYFFSDCGLTGDGSTPPSTNTTGQIISTVATGLPPLVIASTTNIPNLNASSLSGATFAAPGPIGSTTPSTGTFTSVSTASGPLSGSWNCTNVTPVTVSANVATDQNLMACTIPAGTLNSVGKTLRIYIAGVYSTPAASTSAVTLKAKLCTVSGCGSGTVISPISITSAALGGITATNDPFNLAANSSTQTAGASSAYEAHGNLTIDISALASAAEAVYADNNTATVGTIDSTVQLFLQITIAFSNASASNSVTLRQLIVDSVN